MPRMAEASQQIADRKQKAIAAFHTAQVLVPLKPMPLQSKTYLCSDDSISILLDYICKVLLVASRLYMVFMFCVLVQK
jgi:hypothetical protein